MRIELRGSPSRPGHDLETGYVEADWTEPNHQSPLADGAGHTFKLLGRAWIMAANFWLSEAQWQAVAPPLPMVHAGPVRQDDRRIISGIVHRLHEGCRWRA